MRKIHIVIILLLIPAFNWSLDQKALRRVIEDLKSVQSQGGDILGYASTVSDYLKQWHGVSAQLFFPKFLPGRTGRSERENLDYFSLLSGGLAIRESLQLESIRALGKSAKAQTVPLASLKGPEIKSHPFAKMLEGRGYTISPLSRLIPEDFYYFQTGSLSRTLDLVDYVAQKGGSLYKRFESVSIDLHQKDKILTQMALLENKEARILYDTVIEELAVTGSDPFFRSGTDISMIFKLKKPLLFYPFIRSYRAQLQQQYQATATTLKIGEYSVESLTTPLRRVHSYLAALDGETAIITNSLTALRKILKTQAKEHPSLADAKDFLYMSSLYKKTNPKDSVIYLSDAFIRYLVGPALRIKEARRLKEAQRLAALEKFSLFYRHLLGKNPASIASLIKGLAPLKKAPEHQAFFQELFQGLSLDKNSLAAKSKIFGKLGYLSPCLEQELTDVSREEAKAYENFVKEYSSFWQSFFDPIGIRISFEGKKLTMETHILPLINNSIYDALASQLGGTSVTLPKIKEVSGDVFSLHLKLNHEPRALINNFLTEENHHARDRKKTLDFTRYFGESVSFFMQDSAPRVDFDSGFLLREFLFSGNRTSEKIILPILLWSLFHPLRISLPLTSAASTEQLGKALDRKILNSIREEGSGSGMGVSIYQIQYKGETIRVFRVNFYDTLVFRFYLWMEKALHLTTTETYMKKIIDEREGNDEIKEQAGNILFRFFPSQIKEEGELYRTHFQESLSRASFSNFGTLNLFKRIFPGEENIPGKIYQDFGLEPVCPVGGKYLYVKEQKSFQSSVFGSYRAPLIKLERLQKFFKDFFDTDKIEINLEFTPEGLHTVVEMR